MPYAIKKQIVLQQADFIGNLPKRKFNEIYSDLKNKIETQEYPFNLLIRIEFEFFLLAGLNLSKRRQFATAFHMLIKL